MSRIIRLCAVLATMSVVVLARAEEAAKSDASLEAMRARAGSCQVSLGVRNTDVPLGLRSEPVFRYSDPVRGIRDASLWVWHDQGVPVCFQKIEDAKNLATGELVWIDCIASTAAPSLKLAWPDGRVFQSKNLPARFSTLPDEVQPAGSAAARLQQLRNAARQFSATISLRPNEENKSQMRMLAKPLVEYASPDRGILAGAVFGFAFGTNPDLLLTLELTQAKPGTAKWRYSFSRMTISGLSMRRQDREIQTEPWLEAIPKAFDTWVFYFIPQAKN